MEIFIFWILGSIVVAIVASSRGRSGIAFFFLSLLISPLLGFVLAVAMGSQAKPGAAPAPAAVVDGEAASPDTHVRCPDCRELVRKDARVCKHCRATLTPQPVSE